MVRPEGRKLPLVKVSLADSLATLQFTVKSLVGENYLLYGLEERQNRHDVEEKRGLLAQHFPGHDDSRRSSFDGSRHV